MGYETESKTLPIVVKMILAAELFAGKPSG